MAKDFLFDGGNARSQFATHTYKRFIGREWFTYADVMADRMLISVDMLPNLVSYCKDYGELRKAFRDVFNAIINEVGEGCIEVQGSVKNRKFRYVGENDNPLNAMINARVIKDLKKYWEFCQDSAGFLPETWLEYYLTDCQDLISIKTKKKRGEQVISSSVDRHQANIEYLPMLYEYIKNHQILSIDYKPYEEEKVTLIFHPHYLKEYNGRWHLFGYVEEPEPKEGIDLALDRIVSKPREVYDKDKKFVCAPKRFYEAFFDNIVGVSHQEDNYYGVIRVRAHSFYIFKLMETKKLHKSQETIAQFEEHDDGFYGEFSIDVEVNNEFIGRILQMGDGLEIVAPREVRDIFREKIEKMVDFYKKSYL